MQAIGPLLRVEVSPINMRDGGEITRPQFLGERAAIRKNMQGGVRQKRLGRAHKIERVGFGRPVREQVHAAAVRRIAGRQVTAGEVQCTNALLSRLHLYVRLLAAFPGRRRNPTDPTSAPVAAGPPDPEPDPEPELVGAST